MPILHYNNVTMENITAIGNVSSLPEFIAKVNYISYGGQMIFFLLCAAWVIMYMAAQRKEDQPVNNMLYVSAVVSAIALFFRFVYFIIGGVEMGLLSDVQMWIFPIATAVLAVIVWQSED